MSAFAAPQKQADQTLHPGQPAERQRGGGHGERTVSLSPSASTGSGEHAMPQHLTVPFLVF